MNYWKNKKREPWEIFWKSFPNYQLVDYKSQHQPRKKRIRCQQKRNFNPVGKYLFKDDNKDTIKASKDVFPVSLMLTLNKY